MDLIKIGKYIAEKRKGLGMTQKQVAEKLGMSDKSVSKWERGICLPDVSVYMELCDILEISIHEFLAGEDISKENIIKKSEDNLIQVTKDNNRRQKYLKYIILVLSIIVVAAAVVFGCVIWKNLDRPKNYILPVDQDSVEMKTAELLSGTDGAFLFKYSAKEGYKTLTLYLSEYHSGKLTNKRKVADISYEHAGAPAEGMVVLVPDFEKFAIKLILADDCSKLSNDIPILENVENRAYYGRSAAKIEERTAIRYNTEQALAVLIYDNDEMNVLPVLDIANGKVGAENDYMYYFSFLFGK